jgi:glycosyltransferase involved in cell wall biosynthesis
MIDQIVPTVLVKNEEYWLPYCLESISGRFKRVVIYDVGSEDRTRDIIEWYTKKEKKKHGTEFRVRLLPHCDPVIQGTFRNALIAETQENWYLILDGDEVYRPRDLDKLAGQRYYLNPEGMTFDSNKVYGVFRRIEVLANLEKRYDVERTHHRLYHRSAIWDGTHPGEIPVITQRPSRELDLPEIKCLHLHNAARSSLDDKVPRRIKRRVQATYHPGEPVKFDLLKEYPIFANPIEDFPVNPVLRRLQEGG